MSSPWMSTVMNKHKLAGTVGGMAGVRESSALWVLSSSFLKESRPS